MINNPTFYPTPPTLIDKMIAKIVGNPYKFIDPSAGRGDILERLLAAKYDHWSRYDACAIEIDPELQATLRGKKIKLIDTDFLSYSGPDKFDLIIANPPFDEGDKHLLKAIDIMYRGQILFLLNAETIRNPYTNTRKLLARKLGELGAEIEYIKDGFIDAERKTNVEVALIDIKIDRKIEDDLFAGCNETRYEEQHTISDKYEVSTGNTVEELVADYNQVIKVGTETILAFYRNYSKIGKYLCMNEVGGKGLHYSGSDLTEMVQNEVNAFLVNVRTDFWRRTLELEEVRDRLTKKKQDEFEHALAERCHMDFTENNIRQFVITLVGSYEQILTEAVLDVFDMFTVRYCYHGGVNEENIHYFNGWKTNNAFKVGHRVIVPGERYGSSFFSDIFNKWDLEWETARMLNDIDKVMSYFDGMNDYLPITAAIEQAFKANPKASRQGGIKSTYFIITCHKKGTIHLTFRDQDILRRFNVVACRGKGWLPGDFGLASYEDLTQEEKSVVDSFEGKESYSKHFNKPLFRISGNTIRLEHKKAA